jgi:hypothetical protein
MTPEQKARQRIDKQLEQCGWAVQDYEKMNLDAGARVAASPPFPVRREGENHRAPAFATSPDRLEVRP